MKTDEIKVVVVNEDQLNSLKSQIEILTNGVAALMNKIQKTEIKDEYIQSLDIPDMLGISSKTWQTYRDRGQIPFIQFGHKIWVKKSDFMAFMDSHRKGLKSTKSK